MSKMGYANWLDRQVGGMCFVIPCSRKTWTLRDEPQFKAILAILDDYERARPLLQECLDQFTAFFDEAWKTVGNGDAERPWNNIERKLRAALRYRQEKEKAA